LFPSAKSHTTSCPDSAFTLTSHQCPGLVAIVEASLSHDRTLENTK
jgi:hypothetical protein